MNDFQDKQNQLKTFIFCYLELLLNKNNIKNLI